MIVIDSSAVVAMIFGEPSAGLLAARLAAEPRDERLISAPNYVEAGTVLAGRRRDPAGAIADLDDFLAEVGVRVTPVDDADARVALEARIRLGKGFGATAGLNFGDCFAYALATRLEAPLLYVGDDFTAAGFSPAV